MDLFFESCLFGEPDLFCGESCLFGESLGFFFSLAIGDASDFMSEWVFAVLQEAAHVFLLLHTLLSQALETGIDLDKVRTHAEYKRHREDFLFIISGSDCLVLDLTGKRCQEFSEVIDVIGLPVCEDVLAYD